MLVELFQTSTRVCVGVCIYIHLTHSHPGDFEFSTFVISDTVMCERHQSSQNLCKAALFLDCERCPSDGSDVGSA